MRSSPPCGSVQRVAADFFAARERREKFLFLLLGAEPMNGTHTADSAPRESPGGSADAGNFFMTME